MQNNMIKYLSAAALATVADALPSEYNLIIGSNYMPQIRGTMQNQGPFNFLIETNSAQNIAFSQTCSQNVDLVTPAACSAAPTLVTQSIDESSLTGVGANFFDLV